MWSRALAWTIISTASFGFIFAVFAKIDEVVWHLVVKPLGAERPVKAPFAGVIKDIVVKKSLVTTGDTLPSLTLMCHEKERRDTN